MFEEQTQREERGEVRGCRKISVQLVQDFKYIRLGGKKTPKKKKCLYCVGSDGVGCVEVAEHMAVKVEMAETSAGVTSD